MPQTKSIRFNIGGKEIEVSELDNVPVALSYSLEEVENFEKKKSATAFDITLPATISNSKIYNTPHNPNVEDLTSEEFFKSHQPCSATVGGVEVFKGKSFLKEATHTNRPESISINCYGNNGDWMVDLAEKSLHDFVNAEPHVLNNFNVTGSWDYDGLDQNKDFVYAPVRYGQPFLEDDKVVGITQLKPSISIYWLLYRAFKAAGYSIVSDFMNTEYFRRMVLPWVWGTFYNFSEDDKAKFKFKARPTSEAHKSIHNASWNEVVSPNITSGGSINEDPALQWGDTTSGGAEGGYDNARDNYGGIPSYQFVDGHKLRWRYLPAVAAEYGALKVTLGGEVYYFFYAARNFPVGKNTFKLVLHWLVNGVEDVSRQTVIKEWNAYNGTTEDKYFFTQEFLVNSGDVIECYFKMHADTANGIDSTCSWVIGRPTEGTYYELQHAKRIAGSTIDFKDFEALKKYKILDLLRGVIDTFNLSVQTDSIRKVVTIEPTYPYYLSSDPTVVQSGYFKKERLSWTDKQDLSKENKLILFSDSERELFFRFKNDSNDGGVNILNKRHSINTGEAKYLFPQRFKSGKREAENRFFSASTCIQMNGWKGITGIAPYLMAIVPENISNTSKSEDATLFQPRIAYYKGFVPNVGGWKYNAENGSPTVTFTWLPYLFAVNYHKGGERDPVLTYNDQKLPGGQLGIGLMRRFYLPRLAVMRHGKLYEAWMRLNLNDIANWLHREAIDIRNAIYYLIDIQNYQPLRDESTLCQLWKFHPVTEADDAACYPSRSSVLDDTLTSSEDIKYQSLLLLPTDLPQ